MGKLTHFDKKGMPRMVDVGAKASTERTAVARGTILMNKSTLALIKKGGIKKGDVMGVADVAAVMGAKKTPEIIPMCHPLQLTNIEVAFDTKASGKRAALNVTVTAKCNGQTGVEMEALTGAAIALLTVYDMCKAADKGMTITNVELMEKLGGKSGHWKRSNMGKRSGMGKRNGMGKRKK